MKKAKSLPLTTQAYLTLKERIMDLRFRPGELLLVQPLSKELGISRTPVREALVRLLQEGFVEEAEGKKFKVSELTLSTVLQIHEIRELLECHAVDKVARNRTQGQIDALRKLTDEMEKALSSRDQHRFFEADLQFHSRIIDFCGNQILRDLNEHLIEKIQRIRFLTIYVSNRLEETIDEHATILEGILQQNPARARQAVTRHLTNVRKGVETLFAKEGPDLFRGLFIQPSSPR